MKVNSVLLYYSDLFQSIAFVNLCKLDLPTISTNRTFNNVYVNYITRIIQSSCRQDEITDIICQNKDYSTTILCSPYH